jgi:hypothetical protein
MHAFKAALLIGWLAMVTITAHAVAALGPGGLGLFVSDLSHPWRAQFNIDFSVHLLLVSTWIIYREGRSVRGLLLAAPMLLGSLYLLPYLLHATYRASGQVDVLLLGHQSASQRRLRAPATQRQPSQYDNRPR